MSPAVTRSGILVGVDGSAESDAAIRWAKTQDTLTWLDAEVFGHNEPALRLHRKLGFVEVGRVSDMYRIEGRPVDDIRLALRLRTS